MYEKTNICFLWPEKIFRLRFVGLPRKLKASMPFIDAALEREEVAFLSVDDGLFPPTYYSRKEVVKPNNRHQRTKRNTGVNFTNMFTSSFYTCRIQRPKKIYKSSVSFCAFGIFLNFLISQYKKIGKNAANKMLGKLTTCGKGIKMIFVF